MDSLKDFITQNNIVLVGRIKSEETERIKSKLDFNCVDYKFINFNILTEEDRRFIAKQPVTKYLTAPLKPPIIFYKGKYKEYNSFINNNIINLSNCNLSTSYDFDIIVLGGGTGGLIVAKEVVSCGKNVAVCNSVPATPFGNTWDIGGTCINVGCVPKKMLHKAGRLRDDFVEAHHYGWILPSKRIHNWNKLIAEVQGYIKGLNKGYRQFLHDKSIHLFEGFGHFVDKHTVRITYDDDTVQMLTAKTFVVATGCRPNYPDIPGAREYGITSDDVFNLPYHPGKVLVVGASYVALEFTGFMASLDIDCTVMVRSVLLRGFDQQFSKLIESHLMTKGVKFIKNCIPTSIEKVQEGIPGVLKVFGKFLNGNKYENEFNTVLFAIGRNCNVSILGVEDLGIKLNPLNGKLLVDENGKTDVDNIYGVGDVVDDIPELQPVVVKMASSLGAVLCGKTPPKLNFELIPTAIFTPIEYGSVGLSEENAVSIYGKNDTEIYDTYFQPLEFELAAKEIYTAYAKIICVKSENYRVVGLHVFCPNADEIIAGFTLAIKLGATKSDFDNFIGVHPTNAEVFNSLAVRGEIKNIRTAC